jgi:hypothetical protein
MNSCNDGHSHSATLTTATSIEQWSCQQHRRRTNRYSSRTSRRISTSSETNKTVLPLRCAKSEEHNNDNDINSSDYENSNVPLCVFVPDKELDGLTNSHDKLNTLDNTQECLSNSNHKIGFDDDEDTMS